MKKVFNRRNVLLTLIAIVVLPLLGSEIWSRTAAFRGRHAAERDLARGRYVVLGYGLPPRGVAEYKQILREKYGVEYRQVALCIVSRSLVAYADSYDKISGDAIRQKFGNDILKHSWDEANQEWLEKHTAELQQVSHSE